MAVCAEPGCPEQTDGATRCQAHTRARQRTTRARYQRNDYGPTWPAVRRAQLRREPNCRHCALEGRVTPAAEVDHVEPFDPTLPARPQHHPSNLQSLCKPHHSRKTATVDSAFGRSPRPG